MLPCEVVLPQLRRLSLHGPGLLGGQVSYTHMRPPVVVGVNDFIDTLLRMGGPAKDLVVAPFRFLDAVRTLRNGVFIRISILGHADPDPALLQHRHILL